jgi:glycosyltransferase involved in cell wall biosynthesis
MNRIRTCVYAIALNEIKHVDKFMEASREADVVLVCDTGSTDGTPERLRELGAVVHTVTQRPWRFDVPRNTALSLVPADIDFCLSIDLDEYLQPGWSAAMDRAWQQHQGRIHRMAYDYIWNWNADGTPATRFFADKVHHRRGFRWRHPCHETLYYEGPGQEIKITVPEMQLHHHADNAKSRGQYLPLLKMAVAEDPDNDRMSHYYGRELMFYNQNQEAITELKRHLNLPRAAWLEERCASMRFIARCYSRLNNHAEAMSWAIRATQEWPHSREPWLELARVAYGVQDWATCYWAVSKCLAITERTASYISDGACWGSEPWDLGGIAAWYSGNTERSREWCLEAYRLAPGDQRLLKNCITVGVDQASIDSIKRA